MICKSDEGELKRIMGKAGHLHIQYGGYEILVQDRKKFPWEAVLNWLFDCELEICIKREGKEFKISAKTAW